MPNKYCILKLKLIYLLIFRLISGKKGMNLTCGEPL